MKKLVISMCLVLFCMLQANAQEPQIVSTEPSNRNVLIEEFTGRLCGYCPWGQYFVNQTIKENPGRVFTVNIHSQSSLSPTSYPNLNTLKGADIATAFNKSGALPRASVNRSEDEAVGLNTVQNYWNTMTLEQLNQTAECNIAGTVTINPDTRLARITVEVYYTGDSKAENNYLTVLMMQDSIMGDQSGADYNPEQIVDGQYCHMHVFRNIITEKWGDEIAPTTAGSFIKKTYKYTIPESIGSPNGVDVDLNNVHFLAFVAETRGSGAKTMPILNVCKLEHIEKGEAVEEVTETSSMVYPNPVKDILTITADDVKQVVMYNSLGQIVKNVKSNDANISIDVRDLESGMYFVNIIDNSGNVTTNKVSVLK
ncbi:MAG: Omp28-related outer membrane protein [Bacteroidales bacterium]|nr:Omp28-related outer membrane protein [Bacteroidales bacterium]